MGKKRVFIIHNGCQRRALDVSKLVNYFQLNNCAVTRLPQRADFIVFVTCGFIASKEDECFEMIRSLKECRGELIVAGCLPATASKKLAGVFQGVTIVTKNLSDIDKVFRDFKVKFSTLRDANVINRGFYARSGSSWSEPPAGLQLAKDFLSGSFSGNMRRTVDAARNRIGRIFSQKPAEPLRCSLRISSGCRGKCSYCIIRNAIGALKSKELHICLEEYKQLLEEGYESFGFVADDAGAYGMDIGSSFAQLLETLSGADHDFNVEWRIHHLHPEWLVKYEDVILPKIREGKITWILSAIQSGSSRILGLMNRYSDTGKIGDVLKACRAAGAHLKLTTNVIAGFPGETDADFLSTLRFIKEVHFDLVYLFSYCDNADALSFKLGGKIGAGIIEDRLHLAKNMLRGEGIKYFTDYNHSPPPGLV